MKVINKIINIFLSILIIFVLAVLGSYAYSKYIKKDEVVNSFGYAALRVQTNSMYPEIIAGQIVIIKLNEDYEPGDIITYKEDGALITHRITRMSQKGVVTKGDNNNKDDGVIETKRIVGVVKYIL